MGRTSFFSVGAILFLSALTPPAQARFLQVDPVGYDDQVNLYAYVHNDPINNSDPDGKQTVEDMQMQAQIADMRMQGYTEKQIQREISSQAKTQAVAISLIAAPEVALATRLGAVAVNLMRTAEFAKPVISGLVAASQRMSAVTSGLKSLAAGEGRIIAGGGAKDAFRGAETAAARYGGKAEDYSKVSVSRLTESGDRVSVHAVRNDVTGKIYEQKVIYGR